jgi:hypothetical protein
MSFEAVVQGVLHAGAHTNVLRQTPYEDTPDTALLQKQYQACVIERGVGIALGVVAFPHQYRFGWQLKRGVEFGAWCPLDAVLGPGASASSKAHMVWRVPVARRNDRGAPLQRYLDPSIEDLDHLVTLRDRQGPTRAKIVLDVNGEQCIVRIEPGGWWDSQEETPSRIGTARHPRMVKYM